MFNFTRSDNVTLPRVSRMDGCGVFTNHDPCFRFCGEPGRPVFPCAVIDDGFIDLRRGRVDVDGAMNVIIRHLRNPNAGADNESWGTPWIFHESVPEIDPRSIRLSLE